MSRTISTQFNVRSSFARQRAHELARQTGMTATQIVEEALRAYVPPKTAPVGRLVRRGSILVLPGSGRTITLEGANAALEAVRNRDGED
ncbi:hypothetical protein SAMN05444678_102133 [Sphingomonas sp. YR710]|uniref:hypothetical protein n=1 Tax=Sphingomonas sp. YR710 TaxID=1882773 RepID=UPI0008901D78|nr:hypothetical protein [Sphingomonas sp. YR710]SDC26645.1 hypothetical protein SAMN05444678_102133 [Sphingomonas sp. YR710]